jgi:CheY-like chemotaxis protein
MASKKIIFLVDDDVIFQKIMKIRIEKKSLSEKLLSFANGETAFDYLNNPSYWTNESLPDLIFLDINMPVMNGWQFLDAFNAIVDKLPKSIQIFMLSSSIDDRDIEKARSYHTVSDYLSKPLSDEGLEAIFTIQPEEGENLR